MELLLVNDELRAFPSPDLLVIDEFKALIRRDKGSDRDYRGNKKLMATKELGYIYHCVNHQSPYASNHFDVREEEVRRAVFKENPDWEPDHIVEEAMEKYRELISTPSIHMLNAAVKASQELTKYFEEIDLTKTDDHGKLINSAKDLVANLGNLGKVVEGLRKLKEQIELDQNTTSSNRRSVETNIFSE